MSFKLFILSISFFIFHFSFFIFPNLAFAQTTIEDNLWDREQYQYYVGDFNGDGQRDVFLQGKSEDTLNQILMGTETGKITALVTGADVDFSKETFRSDGYSQIVVGDFNGDSIDDLLSLAPSNNQAEIIFGGENVFNELIREPVDITGKVNFDLNGDTQLYSGDFNGDGLDDILIVSPNASSFVIYHASYNKNLTFIRQNVIDLNTEHRRSIFIDDYNGDGFADIVAFPVEPNFPHLVYLADSKGTFSTNDLKEFTVAPENLDWSTNNNTLLTFRNAEDGSIDIIRLKNSVGGIDEEGNTLDENEEVTIQTLEELNANSCLQIAYSPGSELTEYTCAPWFKKIEPQTKDISDAPSFVGDEGEPPYTPYYAPNVAGGSYHKINTSYTVTGLSVGGTEDYYMQESTDNSSYTYVGGKSVTRTQSSAGYRYYKYKACNEYGCSGFSPYLRIYIYTNPEPVVSFSATPSAIYSGQSSALSWTTAGGMTLPGTYVLQVKKPGSSSYTSLGSKSQYVGSPFSYPVTPSSGAGTYSYRIKACNPNNLCGGWSTASVVQVNRPPTISGAPSTTVDENSTYSFTPTASDPDDDILLFSIAGKPSWVSFSNSTGKLSGTPTYSQSGTYSNIRISVSDGTLSVQLSTFSITVENINRAPTISGTPSTTVDENSAYSFTPTNQ